LKGNYNLFIIQSQNDPTGDYMSVLFEPIDLGTIKLANRIIMAPLTRARAGVERLPNDVMAKYYAQRATAGLIISEATSVTPMGVGYANTPGIWSQEQVNGWKKITEAVHAKGGRIVMQLWHVGRISDPMFLDGKLPVAPSAIAAEGRLSLVRPEKNYVIPRALELSEIPEIVEAYRKGAQNAKEAGFDGVEIHGANGYLLDQFLQDSTNKRTDKYGGSLENRARLALEVTDAVISVWGADKVGYHIAPRGDSHTMGDSDLEGTFTYLVKELGNRKIAFIFSREHRGAGYIGDKLKKAFGGNYIINEKLDKATAEAVIKKGEAQAAAFGMNYISNPDLVRKFQEDIPLTPVNMATIYGPGEVGYSDY
jgi:2,4-dienoyl-CoA reductase-like NADH-dependent reductase (Old Yellow Enzyme family)